MNERLEKVKQHFVDHRELYIGIGVGIAVTVAGVSIFELVDGKNIISQKAIAIWKSTITQIATQIYIKAPGNSGNVIQDLTTGTIYPSQNAAAKALDIGQSSISKQLAGTLSKVDGHVFKKLIDGAISHELHTV